MQKSNSANEMPARDATDFRYHRLEKENQYSDLQVPCEIKLKFV